MRAAHERGDSRERGVRADAFDAHEHRSIFQHAAGDQQLVAALRHRRGLAAEQRFVHAAALGQQHAVGRHDAAFGHAHAVADAQLVDADALQRSVVALPIGERRRQPRQRIGEIARAMPRAHFQVAARQQEEHEHRNRIEVHLAAAAQRFDDAGRVHRGDGQCHRHVHADPACRERAPRAREERPRRIENHRRRHQQAEPAQQLARGCIERAGGAEVDRRGIHHGLHGAEARDQQPLERVARFAAPQVIEAARVERQRVIAGARQRLQQLRQA